MSDPYNSYGSQVAPMPVESAEPRKPFVAPDPIERADVSETWKRRFRTIRDAGGPDLPNIRALPFGERFAVTLNLLAFLFGPIYFIVKGMYRQALGYFMLSLVCLFVLEMIGLGRHFRALGAGISAVYGARANVSYYRLVIDRESRWF
ncbi:DUF2628 domain-containing protein [Luteibacter sp. dw_328]|uniref:DUF2628 domain-containing protein n=1 Tax=Luteibacter sp. dw_328 TaxID=2719796 RepID=UPI001BD3A202|nr:DUF2628 domain-containing protein [Luteibacter sp. dw_328]